MDPAIGKRILTIDDFSKCWTSYIMLFNPKKKLLYYKDSNYLNKLILEVIVKNKRHVFNIVLLSIIFMILSFIYTLYLQIVIDISNYNKLLLITFIFSLLLITKCIISFFRNKILISFSKKIDCTCMLNTFQKVLLLPFNYYKNRTTGEIISRINDLIYVKNILNKIILTVFLDLILFVSSSIILMILNMKLFIILVIISLIYILIYYLFRNKLKKYININQENSGLINSFLVESITGFETIKNLNMESIIKERMDDIYLKALNDNFVYDNICNLEIFLKDLISMIGILIIEFLGISQVIKGEFTLGTCLTFTFLTNYFISPIANIIELSKEYFYANNAIKRVNNLFEIDSEDLVKRTNFKINGDILLKNLNFSYNGQNYVLTNFNMTIKEGEKVVILGNSGAGKSTIFKLLLKYYPVDRGNIFISNIDINDYSITNIRENISCISQNELLYTDTIKNNILMNKSISDDEFMKVCKLVYLDEFTNKLFLGYDTKLEENGLNLSGGQRQRIILARMLLQNKKIMLIDEGLNAIDVNLERKILENIFKEYPNRTIIVISHRMENLDLFSQVVKLENMSFLEKVN